MASGRGFVDRDDSVSQRVVCPGYAPAERVITETCDGMTIVLGGDGQLGRGAGVSCDLRCAVRRKM